MGVYICYDKAQRNFFRDRGLKDVVYGLHPEEFNKAIKEWLGRKT